MQPLPAFYIALAVVYVVVVAVSLAIYIMRRHHEPIRSREYRPAIGATVDGAFFFVLLAAADAILYEPTWTGTVSCNLVIWPSVLIAPLLVMPYFVRGFMLYYRYQLAMVRSKGITDRDATWLYRNRWVLNRFVWVGATFITLVLTVITTSGVLASAGVENVRNIGEGCNSPHFYVVIAQAVFCVAAIFALMYVCFPARDQFYFKYELAAIQVIAIPMITIWGVSEYHPDYFYIPGLSTPYNPNLWIYILIAGFLVTSIWFPIYLSYTPEFRRSRPFDEESHDHMDSLDLQTVVERVPLSSVNSATLLEAVFRDEELLLAFKQYAITCFCVENVNFIVDVRKFSVLSGDSVKAEAVRIQQLYFQPSSPFELNLDDSIVASINEAIAEGNVSLRLFEQAEKKIWYLLLTDTFYRWRTTREFATVIKASSLADAIDVDPKAREMLSPAQRKAVRALYRTGSGNSATQQHAQPAEVLSVADVTASVSAQSADALVAENA